MSDVVGLLIRYGYIAVFAVILLENLGLPRRGSRCSWWQAASARPAR